VNNQPEHFRSDDFCKQYKIPICASCLSGFSSRVCRGVLLKHKSYCF